MLKDVRLPQSSCLWTQLVKTVKSSVCHVHVSDVTSSVCRVHVSDVTPPELHQGMLISHLSQLGLHYLVTCVAGCQWHRQLHCQAYWEVTNMTELALHSQATVQIRHQCPSSQTSYHPEIPAEGKLDYVKLQNYYIKVRKIYVQFESTQTVQTYTP